MNKANSKKEIIGLDKFEPRKEDVILLDTNVMIRIFMPYIDKTGKDYSELWGKLMQSESKLIVSSIQISEIINRCIRIEFDLYKKNMNQPNLNYKMDYRSTDDYRNKMDDILDIISTDIVSNFEFIDDNFSKMDTIDIFKRGFSYDFNDALLVEIAKQYNTILVTDDYDFANYKIDNQLVTSNKLLLSMSF